MSCRPVLEEIERVVDEFLFSNFISLPGDTAGERNRGRSWEGEADIVRLTMGRSSIPFFWQLDRRLLLLDEDAGIWSFAELEFDPSTCRYVEIRRAGYEMEREAVGVLLSRVLFSGLDEVARASAQLNNWLICYFGHTIDESRSRPRIGNRR